VTNPFNDCETIEETMGQMAGAVSMCWDPRPTGVFDSESAAAFVDAAIARVKEIGRGSMMTSIDALVERLGLIAFRLDALDDQLGRVGRALENHPGRPAPQPVSPAPSEEIE